MTPEQRLVLITYATFSPRLLGEEGTSLLRVVPPLSEADRVNYTYSYLVLDGDWEDKVGSVIVLRRAGNRWEVVTEEDE